MINAARPTYTVRGKSEDGDKFWNGAGWSDDRDAATALDFDAACTVQDTAKAYQLSLSEARWLYSIVID